MQILSYDDTSQTLLVELTDFPHYEVFDVPSSKVDELRKSNSPQNYFNDHIWGNKFEHDSHWPSLQILLEYLGENMMFEPPVTVQSTQGGDTPLHVACVWGDISAIELLLSGGADINARGDMGTTPLFNAVSFGRVRSTERLLKAGASADDSNEFAITTRERALRSNNPHRMALFR